LVFAKLRAETALDFKPMLDDCVFKSYSGAKTGAAVLQAPTSNAGHFKAQRRFLIFCLRSSGKEKDGSRQSRHQTVLDHQLHRIRRSKSFLASSLCSCPGWREYFEPKTNTSEHQTRIKGAGYALSADGKAPQSPCGG